MMKHRFMGVAAFVSLLAAFAARAETIVLECERFENRGGWSLDSQFIDEMGSSYLLAHGLGKPVADATTTFEVKKAGTYNVFVRTKNWTAKWVGKVKGEGEERNAAGRFKLIVNGVKMPKLLGVQGKGEWLWVKVGEVELKSGSNTLALHDVSGFDGRCDAICFSSEIATASDAIRPTNNQQPTTNNQQPATNNQHHDLVVVGGGIAGICTAISAARLGLKVALVQDRPVLGGANSSEVRVHLGGYQNLGPYPRLGDVVREIGPAKGGNARPAAQYEDDRKLAAVKAEKNITLYLNTRVVAVEKVKEKGEGEQRRIHSVVGRNVVTGERTRFAAPLFADSTGDGCVGYLAGADYRLGRESKAETGEKDAVDVADRQTLGASCQWYAEKLVKSSFPSEPWMIRFNEEAVDYKLRGDWDWETGMNRDQLKDFETVRDYAMLVAYSNWNHVKNVGKRKAEFADAELVWLAYVAGKRETRRLMGDHILTYDDVFEERPYPDGTCCTTWAIDLHYPMPANQRHYDGEPFRSICTHDAHYAYPIPYRCFYSRNVPNLFMAGRDISVTHVALGTTRVMRTHGMMGEVVGMAASLCKKYGCDPRGVYTDHLDELKSLMAKGVGQGKPQPPQDYNLGALKKTTYGWNAQSLTRNGKPWVPVMGEMHYSRVPKAEWRDYVRKMKAGGVDIIASYVFWNHHESACGKFDFTDRRDVGAFVRLCAEEGMLVCLRLGPWAHGEAREGGLPDWLFDAAKYGRIRTGDPKFLLAVERFWRALYAQVDGALCKQGGPIVAVQLENESPGPWSYFAALKALAKKVGFDVPYYTRTGWPKFDGEPVYGEILPLFGGYADGFWSRSNEMSPGAYRDAFRFSATRTSTTIATDFFGTSQSDKDAADVKRYPYLTCELGGGMVSSYQRRLQTFPMDAFAMAVQRLGSGSNLLGYYMYAGGTNPSDPAKGVFTNESTSGRYTNHNDLPVFSYEFNAPISEFGELNPHYRMLKAVHDFCHQYGPEFATIAPDIRSDTESRRGRFVFHNDYVRGQRPDGNAWIGIDENGAIRRLVDGRALLAEAEREIAARPPAASVGFRFVKPAGPARTIPERGKGFPMAPTEADWEQAAVYALETPAERGLLVVDYLGDCARLYVDDVPVADDFYKGLPFKAGLWRYPAGKLTVRILPWTDSPLIYVQAPFRPKERGAALRSACVVKRMP